MAKQSIHATLDTARAYLRADRIKSAMTASIIQVVTDEGSTGYICCKATLDVLTQALGRAGKSLDHVATLVAEHPTIDPELWAANIPGLDEVRDAYTAYRNDASAVQDSWGQLMTEDNDGVSPPRDADSSLKTTLTALQHQYPRAALWMRADTYTYAANHHKSGAGHRAKDAILYGESIETATGMLDNWLPQSATWA